MSTSLSVDMEAALAAEHSMFFRTLEEKFQFEDFFPAVWAAIFYGICANTLC